MMTIRRLSIGAGYKYLLKSIAVGDGPEGTDQSDLIRYYSDTGTPPGVFLGAGLVGLNNGLSVAVGQSMTAKNLQRMLQDCADPITGELTESSSPYPKGCPVTSISRSTMINAPVEDGRPRKTLGTMIFMEGRQVIKALRAS